MLSKCLARSSTSDTIHTCRGPMHCKSAWPDLPQGPVDQILLQLYRKGGLSALASFRLVCKGWHSALQQHPGTPSRHLVGPDDLLHLCKMIPSMAKLCISSPRLGISLHAVSSCENLKQMELIGDLTYCYKPKSFSSHIDLSLLPTSMKDLQLKNVMPDASSLSGHGNLNLTRLDLLCQAHLQDAAPNVLDLLAHLPTLKARTS